ncbi:unnamed protein product [Ectocarpus sp. 6 AP-2014]
MHASCRKDGKVATNNLGMRKSCSECGRKKRKCDGQTPCSRCVGAGLQCTYSKRKPHQRQPQPQHRSNPRGPAGMKSTELLHHSSSGALHASGMLPLKRFRLSASPATGLVGMQENAFLSDFFGCVGFLPLTTQSHIRETMVRIMAPSTTEPELCASHNSFEQDHFDAIPTEDAVTMGNQLSTGLSGCTFWCAVGLGALVKGSPVVSVANYLQLARDALDAYTGPVNAEVAKAWAILGYLYSYMGDTEKYEEYLKLSASFLIDSIEQGATDVLPAGFAEMVHHKETAKAYSGNVDATDNGSLGAHHQHPLQIIPAASEGDVFRYVAQSLIAFEQVVFEKSCEDSATRKHSSDDKLYDEKTGGATPLGHTPQVEDVSDAMVAGFKDGLIEFEYLQDTVDRRPNVGTGIVGLLINMTLAYQRAANGDAGGALERFRQCVDVFERYPGVCRCMFWCHIAHGILGSLAAIDDSRAGGLYNRLRDVYNPSRPSSSLPAPPLEEWRGISAFCDDFQCRLIEGMIASQALSVFSAPTHSTSNCTDSQNECEEAGLQFVDEEQDSSMVSVGATPEVATGSIMDAPCTNGDKPMTSTYSWELNQEPMPRTSPTVGPSLSPSHLHCKPVRGGESGTDVLNSALVGCGGGVLPGLVGQVPDMSLTSPLSGDIDGARDEMWDDTIAAADWLDVTHAMLDATDE